MKRSYKIHAISYADEKYSMSKKINLLTAKIFGKVDTTKAYGPEDLDDKFADSVANILLKPRGGGYWVWKPYIILKRLNEIPKDDYLIYTDAGLIYIKRISVLIRHLIRDNQDIFLSGAYSPCKDWTKRDAFILMGCDCEEAAKSTMVSGGYVIVKNTEKARMFITEWLMYASDERIITDIPNECGERNYIGFKQHRHDQSILTLLAWKYGISSYKAVTLVDEPRSHRHNINKVEDAYKDSFYVRMKYMVSIHETKRYLESNYGRMFINTRLRNMSLHIYLRKLIRILLDTMKTDIWGIFFDEYYLNKYRNFWRKS